MTFKNVIPLKAPTHDVIHVVHPIIGCMTIHDCGEFLAWGSPAVVGTYGKTLIGQKSRKPRVIFDYTMWPVLAGVGVDISDPVGHGDAVAAWCNDIITKHRLHLQTTF